MASDKVLHPPKSESRTGGIKHTSSSIIKGPSSTQLNPGLTSQSKKGK